MMRTIALLISMGVLVALFCTALNMTSCKPKKMTDADANRPAPIKTKGERGSTREERDDFAAAEALHMHFAYQEFISKHPNSPLVSRAEQKQEDFGIGQTDGLITIADLKSKYHWNGQTRLWTTNNPYWAQDGLSEVRLADGRTMTVSEKADSPARGIPFAFEGEGTIIGHVCLGNLELYGVWRFTRDGLKCGRDSYMIHPK